MASIADRVTRLVREAVEQQGVSLWDVRFVKEGASHYLRIYIDRPDGVSIDDCTNVSHAVDPLLDEADIIDCSYYLEVCSPGLSRELTRDEHFTAMLSRNVRLRLYSPLDGKKEIEGTLRVFENGKVTVETENGEITVSRSDIAKASLAE